MDEQTEGMEGYRDEGLKGWGYGYRYIDIFSVSLGYLQIMKEFNNLILLRIPLVR